MSNLAQAQIDVEELFMRNHNILLGRVNAGTCDAMPENLAGVAGVRIYMEDGRYVVSDDEGRFHFEGVHPGSHVVRLDESSLSEKFEPVICNEYNQFNGNAYSQFVDLQRGTLWRTDFHVALKPVRRGDVNLQLKAELDDKRIRYTLDIDGGDIDLRNRNLSLVIPKNVNYVPNTSTINGAPLAEPELSNNILTYRLGGSDGAWSERIILDAKVESRFLPKELLTRALLGFSSIAGSSGRTPLAEVRLLPPVKKITSETVFKPEFEKFKVLLTKQQDPIELEKIVSDLRNESNLHIMVVGHTDNQYISAEKRHIYSDNYVLSKARAKSIASYIAERLNLTASQVTVIGMGPDEPVASNDTAEGRSLNRRAEVKITSEVIIESEVKLEGTSAVQTTEAVGLRPGESLQVPGNVPPKPATGNFIPPYDEDWMRQAKPGQAWLWPSLDHYPSIPSTKIVIQHNTGEKPTLLLNGKKVSALNYEGSSQNSTRGIAVSRWFGVDLEVGENHFEAILSDATGHEMGRLQQMVYMASPPAKAELIVEQSRLIADGQSPSIIAVRLTDKKGYPARQGVVGEFSVTTPYKVLNEREDIQALLEDNALRKVQYRVGEDGVALIKLEPTTRTGEIVVNFPFQNNTEKVRGWMEPDARDWIVVGIAEGTVGYNSISGNMQALEAIEAEDKLYADGRVALFAKGRIKGEWLLTLAYDSSKKQKHDRERLQQTIDPDEYYTLYGDTTEQGFEAPSSKRLYLKLERHQFYAMFGDYSTGLTVSELSRYERSLTGVKSELHGDRFGYNLFASKTPNSFMKDEIRGDGTSGLYRLSQGGLVINSEKVTIETRDRFRSEVIISARQMTRHLDYNIDYDDGTLFFKSPVNSRDSNLNPVYIVVDYETYQGGSELLSYGGRGYLRPVEKVEIGATYISEEQVGGDARLSGVDASIILNSKTKLRAEASTSRDASGVTASAHLAELQHLSGNIDAKVYTRQQDDGFGLGQQRGSENATRKTGVEGNYQYSDDIKFNSEIYRQVNRLTDAERELLEASVDYQYESYRFDAGIRTVRDAFVNGDNNRSDQLTLGAAKSLLNNRMKLHLRRDQSLSHDANIDFPTRTLLGADYRLAQSVSLFAEQEFTDGDSIKTQSTRAGINASPWTGGEINTAVNRQLDENGNRLYANLGLVQRWKINDLWSVDASIDHSKTMKDTTAPFNVNVPPASGSGGDDFTAVSGGLNYRREDWSWNARIELRHSETEDKSGVYVGAVGELYEGMGMSMRLQFFDTDKSTGEQHRQSEVRFGLAYRPLHSRWIVLNRSDYAVDRQVGGTTDFDNWKIINNTNANYKSDHAQVSLQYGARYGKGTFDDISQSGYTDLIGAEYRRDLSGRWDLGTHASLLNSRALNQMQSSYGLSLGFNVARDMWASLGYNWDGFRDDDFSASDYTAGGVYLKFRLKFDQHSVSEAVEWFVKQ